MPFRKFFIISFVSLRIICNFAVRKFRVYVGL